MFCKNGVLRNFAKFTEKTCAGVSFLIKLQEKKEILAHVFSCEFCEISNSTIYYRTHLVAASDRSSIFIKPPVDKDIEHSIDQLSTHEIVTKSVTVHEHNPPFANSQQQPQLLETHNALGNLSVDNPTPYPSHNNNPPAHLKNEILNISKNFKTCEPVEHFIDDLIRMA